MVIRKNNSFKRVKHCVVIFLIVVILSSLFSIPVSAAELNEKPEDNGFPYTKYDTSRYFLDYCKADDSWIDAGVVMNLHCNSIWSMSLAISSFTGTAVKEAYDLELVKTFAEDVGNNIQTISGIDSLGINENGLFWSTLFLIVLIIGIYIVYNGLIKHSSSKVVSVIFNFVVVFLLSIAFIGNAPNLILKAAEFSTDLNDAVLNVGSKIAFGDVETAGMEETELIANSIWNIQVKQPWSILQFGTTDVSEERIDNILGSEVGEREAVVRADAEEYNNDNFSDIGKKLGTVFLVFIANLIISIYIFLFAGMMIILQILFIIFTVLMPFVFVLSMLPNMSSKLMKSVKILFDLLISKAVLTLIMTMTFSISALFMRLTENRSYLLVVFLQIICFVGVYMNLPRLMRFVGVGTSEVARSARAMTGIGTYLLYSSLKKARRAGSKNLHKAAKHADNYKKNNNSSKQRPVKEYSGGSSQGSNSKFVDYSNDTPMFSKRDNAPLLRADNSLDNSLQKNNEEKREKHNKERSENNNTLDENKLHNSNYVDDSFQKDNIKKRKEHNKKRLYENKSHYSSYNDRYKKESYKKSYRKSANDGLVDSSIDVDALESFFDGGNVPVYKKREDLSDKSSSNRPDIERREKLQEQWRKNSEGRYNN